MAAEVSYTILVDNEAHAPGQQTEHGLSIWIEVNDIRILFDTGQSGAFLQNAQMAGIDISTASHLVLSHGHYDHTGGLMKIQNVLHSDISIYAHPEIFTTRYSRHSDQTLHEIGLPESAKMFLNKRKAYFHPVTKPTEIAPDVWVTGEVPRRSLYEDTGGDFWFDKECTQVDNVTDDISLWVERDEGLWIFLGCAHSGVVNIVQYIQLVSGRTDIYAIIGGTHLRNASTERLSKTVAFLRQLSPAVLLPCHCSGKNINDLLKE